MSLQRRTLGQRKKPFVWAYRSETRSGRYYGGLFYNKLGGSAELRRLPAPALRRRSNVRLCRQSRRRSLGRSGTWEQGSLPNSNSLLEQAQILLLKNEAVRINIHGQDLKLVGLGDLWARSCDPSKAFAKTDGTDKTPTIVLSHNPDTKELLQSLCLGLALLWAYSRWSMCSSIVWLAPFSTCAGQKFFRRSSFMGTAAHSHNPWSWESAWIAV